MSLFHSNFSKSLISVSFLTIFIAPANAFNVNFTNSDFDTGITGWTTRGDVTTNTEIDRVTPISSPNQAIITNAYKLEGDRRDDNGLLFNQSGTNPVDADTISNNPTGQDLQTFLGLGINDLSIARNPAVSGFPRTSKEGSGMFQDISFTVTSQDVMDGKNGFKLNFNWAYLTNDGQENTYGLGNQDYSFVSFAPIVQPVSSSKTSEIRLLGDSNQSISNPAANNDYNHPTTTYYTAGNSYTQSVTGLAAGAYTYRVGFGVVDVDGYDRSSALLVDNLNAQQVPFEFSPTMGLWIVGGIFGSSRLYRKLKNATKLTKI